ncbi:endonuclease NucS [Phycisphaeraceae bacterium D3-23]
MNTTVWEVNGMGLRLLAKHKLDQEQRLEDWVANDPSLIGLDVLVIGRQVRTTFGGRIDLLGIDQEGDLALIELKRDKTPRDIIAQVLDYASFVDNLGHEDIDLIATKYLGKTFAGEFQERFDIPLPENINGRHQMVIVAAELDDATERIAQYLADRHSISINVVFFNVFEHEGKELVARSWLMDPEVVEEKSEPRKRAPWTGLWYVNLGIEHGRSWPDRLKYGFISAGGGDIYSDKLKKLKQGDRLLAYIKGVGYVGYGEVTQERILAGEFTPEGESVPLTGLHLDAPIPADQTMDGTEEYVVGVRWINTFARPDAKTFTGVFANQNIVCKLRDPATISFLRKEFGINDLEEDQK